MFCQSLALGLLGSRVVYALKEPYTLVYKTLYFVHFRVGKKGGMLVGRLILAKIIFE